MEKFAGSARGARPRKGLRFVIGIAIAAAQSSPGLTQTASGGVPVHGAAVPEFAIVDRVAMRFVANHDVPALSIAIAKEGRLVYARAFGFGDRDRRIPAEPSSLFRIASISKVLTATAVLQLAERGKLRLDDKAVNLLGIKLPKDADARTGDITVRQLLQHTAGFDRSKSGDPMFKSREIARDLKIPSPPDVAQIVRWGLARPLDFTPGERMAYSNFGYVVLGRIIEIVTGQSYERYVQEQVLKPAGIVDMRIGSSTSTASGEVRYYNRAGRLSDSVFDQNDPPKRVPRPYGGWSLESLGAAGGWIASAKDLLKFAEVADGRLATVLSSTMAREVLARPELTTRKPAARYYGLGRFVEIVEPGGEERAPRINLNHPGGLEGTSTKLTRRWNGITFAILMNSDRTAEGAWLVGQFEPALIMALARIKDWPAGEPLLPVQRQAQ